MKDTALLVVDVQTMLIEAHPYDEQHLIANIKRLIAACRAKGIEVIYVRHNEAEDGGLTPNSSGWQIIDQVAPGAGEAIFDKWHNSAFYQTGLEEYLDEKGVKNIILVGLQTEYCIDATCKSAFERGYQVLIPERTHSTYDNRYMSGQQWYTFYNRMWDGRFAKVLPVDEIIENL